MSEPGTSRQRVNQIAASPMAKTMPLNRYANAASASKRRPTRSSGRARSGVTREYSLPRQSPERSEPIASYRTAPSAFVLRGERQ